MTDGPRSFEVSVSPDVLRWARESAGVSLEWAADSVGKLAEEVAAWEEGKGRPTYAMLRSLAERYRRPLAVLLLANPPTEPAPPSDRRSFAGIQPAPLGFESRLALRDAHRLRAVAAEIYEALDIRTLLEVGSVHATASASEAAADERRRLGVGVDDQASWSSDGAAWSSWRGAVERLGVLVFQLRMPVRELRGFSLSEDDQPPTIVVSGRDRVRPRVFTLFHEYGHLLLGAGAMCLPTPSAVRQRTIEGFCNEFAGTLLVPADDLAEQEAADRLRGVDSFSDEALRPLTSQFHVSRYVMVERLRRAGIITEEAYRRKWAQWGSALEEWEEAGGGRGPLPPRQAVLSRGRRFAGLLIDAADRGLISYADLTDYLGVRSKHFDAVTAATGEPRDGE
jgi:Zn-dependent peptidase ImmA (M78 family)